MFEFYPKDVIWVDCIVCKGSTKDPRKRTRKCPKCSGSGKNMCCKFCKQEWPCDSMELDSEVMGTIILKECDLKC